MMLLNLILKVTMNNKNATKKDWRLFKAISDFATRFWNFITQCFNSKAKQSSHEYLDKLLLSQLVAEAAEALKAEKTGQIPLDSKSSTEACTGGDKKTIILDPPWGVTIRLCNTFNKVVDN